MINRTHRTFLRVEELERRDVPSSGLLGPTPLSGEGVVPEVRLRRVVTDTVTTTGQAQGIELTSFQWGVGR
jgi:hypothetical protein